MPPEFLKTVTSLFDRLWIWSDGSDPEIPARQALQAFTFILLHEIGHALIDQLDLPITGLEEDAADQFATVFITGLGWENGRPWLVQSGAYMFEAFSQSRGTPGVRDYWDEHSLHEQRSSNIWCWLYGFDPFVFVKIAKRYSESIDRLERCGYEYQQIKSSWEKPLEPFLKL